MDWPWKDHSSSSSASSPPESYRWSTSPTAEGERHGTRRVMRSSCATEEVEPGKFVRRCEKTEQILRDCVGRPPEVIESKTEHTEDVVTEEMTRGMVPFGSSELQPFSFPGLRSDMEAIEHGVISGLGTFFNAAEEMMNELSQSFGIPPAYRGSSPYVRQVPLVEPPGRGDMPRYSSGYEEFAGRVRDV